MEIQAKMSNKTNKNQRNSPVSLKSLLRKAIRFGTVQEVQRFRWFSDKIECEFNLKRKADPNKEPLFVVMEKEDAKLYQEVLKFNIDLNCRVGTEDMTALHYAVCTGNILAVAMFLYYGFDPDSLTRDNQVPVKLAKSRNMRNVFSDFKQMNRAKFAKKYKLKIPQPTAKLRPFPFLELPPEIQELIWSYVPLVHMWICQFVSKEWLELFRIRTRANTDDDLFPRGQFNVYTKIGYYQTEYHFSFANGCELHKEYYGNMQYIFNNTMPGSQIKAVKKLINFEDTSGSSNDFKEKLYSYKKPGLQCYYIQKSKYFGIAIEITPVDEKTRKEKALAAWFKTYPDRNKQFLP